MQKPYIDRVKEIVKIDRLYRLTEDDIWTMIEKTKPVIFDGHFELLSGRHSDKFFRFSSICQLPYFISKISDEMIPWIESDSKLERIDVVLGVSSQGMFFAFDLASKLKTRVAFAPINKDSGKPDRRLIGGFTIKPEDRVLIVNDMTTTGSGIATLEALAEVDHRAVVVGICMFGNRGIVSPEVIAMKEKYQNRFRAIVDLNMPSWKDNCPICAKVNSLPVIHSKQINHLPIYSQENEYQLYLNKLDMPVPKTVFH